MKGLTEPSVRAIMGRITNNPASSYLITGTSPTHLSPSSSSISPSTHPAATHSTSFEPPRPPPPSYHPPTHLSIGSSDHHIRFWDFLSPSKCYTVSGLVPGQPPPHYLSPSSSSSSSSSSGKLFLCRDSPLPPLEVYQESVHPPTHRLSSLPYLFNPYGQPSHQTNAAHSNRLVLLYPSHSPTSSPPSLPTEPFHPPSHPPTLLPKTGNPPLPPPPARTKRPRPSFHTPHRRNPRP